VDLFNLGHRAAIVRMDYLENATAFVAVSHAGLSGSESHQIPTQVAFLRMPVKHGFPPGFDVLFAHVSITSDSTSKGQLLFGCLRGTAGSMVIVAPQLGHFS
jgi:hypothetical protein